ncbi:hypothetical protein BGX26_000715 [Mortierella sp. AD094]|nr:hypothetical protein BGX26_000715 [Mortierella sp. AD094]
MGHSHSRDKQRHKAKEPRYDHLINGQTGTFRPGNKSGAPHQPLCPTAVFSVTPIAVNAMSQDTPHPSITPPTKPNAARNVPSTNVEDVVLAESEDPAQSPQAIFAQSVPLPVSRYALPEPGKRFTTTPQLAYCLSLIQPSLVSDDSLNEIERKWQQDILDDEDEQERLKAIPMDLIKPFIQDVKKQNTVTEIVSLAAILEQDDFRKLLQVFVDGIDQSVLLEVHLLDGLSQLIRNASQEYIDSDDLVTILTLLHQCIANTHKQSTGHTSEQLSTPLKDYLDELKKSSDAYLVYQAAYASQALMHINDDSSVLKTALQRTGKVVQGISGVVSAVKALDLVGIIDGLNNVQQGLTGVKNLAKLAINTYTNAKRLMESGQGLFQTLQDCFKRKSAWYPALRVLDRSSLECRLSDFEELVRETPCKKDLAFTDIQINELKEHHKFILICDGYDESHCRTEYNGVDYKHLYQPTERNSGGDDELFEEAIITPFDKSQIQEYVERYLALKKQQDASSKDSYWKFEEYQQAFKQIPNLHDLVTNPFLLKLAVEVLPQLLEKNSSYSAAHITRISLKNRFVTQWIERGKLRLGEMELSTQDKKLLHALSRSGFTFCSISYLKEFATAIYDHQGGKPIVSYLEYRNREDWKKSLFNNDNGRNLLREAIPLTHNVGQYRFIHKSVLEYGLSLAVCEPNENDEKMEPISATSRRWSTGSVQSFEEPLLGDDTALPIEQSLLESPLGRINLVHHQSILQFLTERARQQPTFKDQLHSIIEQSKTDNIAKIAAANAITILIRAGVQFIGSDLKGIKIPRADLSYGVFDSACLQGADLQGLIFEIFGCGRLI